MSNEELERTIKTVFQNDTSADHGKAIREYVVNKEQREESIAKNLEKLAQGGGQPPAETDTTPAKPEPQEPSDNAAITTPQGTEWAQISLRVPNKDYLEIKYPGGMKNIEAQEIFSGYGQDGGKLWDMILLLAARGGELPSGQKQHVSRLRAKLRQVLPDIQGDPLQYMRSKRIYKAQFNISGDIAEILGDKYPDI